MEEKQIELVERQPDVVLHAQDVSIRNAKQRSQAKRARRRAAKKKKTFARFSEGLRVQKVYQRKVPPIVEASSSALPPPCITPKATTFPSSSSSLGEESPSYETLFPTLLILVKFLL